MRGAGTFCGLGLLAALASASVVRADDAEARAQEAVRDAELSLTQNTFTGSTGGIRVIDASSGPKGTFRLALNTEFFLVRNYFVPSYRAQHFAGNLSLSVAASRFVEVFASASVTSAWDNSTDPTLVQRVADVWLGVKGYHWIRPWAALGADASVLLPGGVGDMGDTFRATSFGFRVSSNLDFRAHHARAVPLIARFNLQYWFDNTRKLANGIDTPGPLIPFQRFAYGINQVDTVRIGTGLEVPLSAGKVGLRPLVEWRWDIPVNRQGFSCAPAVLPTGDGCLSDVGAKAFPMTLTVGLRILTPPEGLAFTVAADVGLTGTNDFVQQLAPNSPYNVVVGIAYAVDARRKKPPAHSQPRPLPMPTHARTGRVHGLVVDSVTAEPVSGAMVSVIGEPASAQVSGEDGRFVTYALPLGDVVLRIEHPDYHEAKCTAVFDSDPASIEPAPLAEATCELEPQSLAGGLHISVVGKKGRPIPSLAVIVRGPTEHRLVSDDAGQAAVDLPSGAYVAYVDDPAYLVALQEVAVAPREPTKVTLRVLRRPSRPRVLVRERRLVLRSQISFATGSNEILPNSEPILLEVADALLRDPALELVEIEGHTDSRGDPSVNMQLSQARALAVRDWLVRRGVEPARLMATGYGSTQPLVPNITARNRARNRRVQFSIVRRAGTNVAATQ